MVWEHAVDVIAMVTNEASAVIHEISECHTDGPIFLHCTGSLTLAFLLGGDFSMPDVRISSR